MSELQGNHIFNLDGKIAIVTGGSRGIGKEMAIGLGEFGAKVVITGRRKEWLDSAYSYISDLGIECLPIQADVSESKDVNDLLDKTLKRWERVDILINNAGVTWGAPPEEMPLDKWDSVININAKGALICSQVIGRLMIKQRVGNIINVASTTGSIAVDPRIMQAIGYQASKAAIIIMTKQLSLEWAKYNIRVNAIAPFFFETRMTKAITQKSSRLFKQHIPMGRLGREGEIKGAVIFLASQASSYITGHIINIDGGLSAW